MNIVQGPISTLVPSGEAVVGHTVVLARCSAEGLVDGAVAANVGVVSEFTHGFGRSAFAIEYVELIVLGGLAYGPGILFKNGPDTIELADKAGGLQLKDSLYYFYLFNKEHQGNDQVLPGDIIVSSRTTDDFWKHHRWQRGEQEYS